jgi:dTDP-4-dehydrorhamnose reductase
VKDGVVDKCEDDKAQTLMVNLAFPVMLVEVCQSLNITLLHVSTGCLFNGDNGGKGWSETDEPQLSFNTKCGVYVGAKELAERLIRGTHEKHYICRIRLPFDNIDHHRNYLSKLMNYRKAVRATNSLSHRGDFVNACLDMLKLKVPFGTYNVTNPGCVDSEWICEILSRKFKRSFEFWDNEEFMRTVARTPKSNCMLDVDKLINAGVVMRPVPVAVMDSIENWLVETVI